MYCVNALWINFLSIDNDGTMWARRRGKSVRSSKAVSNELQTTEIRTRITQKHQQGFNLLQWKQRKQKRRRLFQATDNVLDVKSAA